MKALRSSVTAGEAGPLAGRAASRMLRCSGLQPREAAGGQASELPAEGYVWREQGGRRHGDR